MRERESHHISPWPLFAAIATIAGLVWWVDLRKQRIRRSVKPRPVEALHEGHGEFVNRAVSNPNTLRDIAWADKIIGFTETAEEVLVSKRARVAEEVVISKTGSDRVETVRETVRRQQIEVERIPVSEGQRSPN